MTPKAPSVVDTRTASERALGESQANYFGGLMQQPDFGYQASAAEEPLFQREQEKLKESIAGYGAEKGFGALRHGPSQSLFAKGAQEMGENRLAAEQARKQAWRDWVISRGQSAATPQGRYVQQGRPSAFSQLAGPVLGGAGFALGGPLGGAIGRGVGSMFGGGAQAQSAQQPTDPYQQQRQGERRGYN